MNYYNEFGYPVDKTAAIVANQSGCTRSVLMQDREELIATVERIKKRRAELAVILGIKTKSQKKNRLYYRTNPKQNYRIKNKDAYQEYLETGIKMKELYQAISEKPKTKKLEYSQVFMNVAEEVLSEGLFVEIKKEALKRVREIC